MHISSFSSLFPGAEQGYRCDFTWTWRRARQVGSSPSWRPKAHRRSCLRWVVSYIIYQQLLITVRPVNIALRVNWRVLACCDVMCCDVMWCDVMWCGVMWCDVVGHHHSWLRPYSTQRSSVDLAHSSLFFVPLLVTCYRWWTKCTERPTTSDRRVCERCVYPTSSSRQFARLGSTPLRRLKHFASCWHDEASQYCGRYDNTTSTTRHGDMRASNS